MSKITPLIYDSDLIEELRLYDQISDCHLPFQHFTISKEYLFFKYKQQTNSFAKLIKKHYFENDKNGESTLLYLKEKPLPMETLIREFIESQKTYLKNQN
jgi:hypothetical protein